MTNLLLSGAFSPGSALLDLPEQSGSFFLSVRKKIMTYDLIDLKLLLSIAKHGTLAQAAAENGLAISSASKRMADLELALGGALFLRHRRGLTLTNAGQIVARHACRVFAELGRMDAEFSTNAIRQRIDTCDR